MHKRGYLHRDIKPENILVSGKIAKVADFGLAKEIRSRPPFTDYVSTRWYRAPEVLLRNPMYGAAVDVWAVGCMMAELFLLRPLFPGSSEPDQLYKICGILGTPSQDVWKDGLQQAAKINYKFPRLPPTPLNQVLPHCSPSAVQMVMHMLAWDPNLRPSCTCAIQFPFFQIGGSVPAPVAAEEAADAEVVSASGEDRGELRQSGGIPATRPHVPKPELDSRRFQAMGSSFKTQENLSVQLLKSAKFKPGVDPATVGGKESSEPHAASLGEGVKSTIPLAPGRPSMDSVAPVGSLGKLGTSDNLRGINGSDDTSPKSARSGLVSGLPTMFGSAPSSGSSSNLGTGAPLSGRSKQYDAFGRKRY